MSILCTQAPCLWNAVSSCSALSKKSLIKIIWTVDCIIVWSSATATKKWTASKALHTVPKGQNILHLCWHTGFRQLHVPKQSLRRSFRIGTLWSNGCLGVQGKLETLVMPCHSEAWLSTSLGKRLTWGQRARGISHEKKTGRKGHDVASFNPLQ